MAQTNTQVQQAGVLEVEFFNAKTDRVPAEGDRETDALVQFLGRFRLLTGGAEKFEEACKRRGMVDKAQRARVGYNRKDQLLVLVPAAASDETALKLTWGSNQRGASLRLRSAFLHYGVEMLKTSVWNLKGSVLEISGLGVCLVFDLKNAIKEVEEAKKTDAVNS